MPHIRTSVKAVIQDGSRVLMIHAADEDGELYFLPGGGQEYREAMHDTLIRECREEIGCEIEVGGLLFVREFYLDKPRYNFLHQVEMMFACSLKPGETPHMGPNPDTLQLAVEWVGLDALPGLRHYPAGLAGLLREQRPRVYLGADF